ncbi:hypothetical protein TNCV_1939681 [Trichonephila clavipes]|nr:hypothetical protein TNCV_1939681 [Trichonephila clavipes]
MLLRAVMFSGFCRDVLRLLFVRVFVNVCYVPSTFKGSAVGSLVVRASDSRPEGLGSMPDATKYPPSTHGVRTR